MYYLIQSLESTDFINSLTLTLLGQISVFAFTQLWKIMFLTAKLIDSHVPMKKKEGNVQLSTFYK